MGVGGDQITMYPAKTSSTPALLARAWAWSLAE